MVSHFEDKKKLPNGQWSSETLFHCGDQFYESVFEEFRKAKKSIYLEVHLYDDKRLGHLFLKEILKALRREISVFIIIDGMTTSTKNLKRWMALFKRNGGQLSFFHPLPWHRFCLKGLLRLNQRNHKKVILIDKEIVFLGSYNIDTRQMSHSYGGEGWRDIGVRLEGSSILTILNGFYDTWKYCRGLKFKQTNDNIKNSIVRLNHKKGWRKNHFEDLILRINNAKDKIWISNPYFVPDSKLIKALEYAQVRGVDIKIIIPQKSDLRLFPLINSIFYRELVRKGVSFYAYTSSVLHAKIMIIDEWMMLGSSNLNSRTQKHDWEIDIVLTHKSSKCELLKRFHLDLSHSTRLILKDIILKQKKRVLYLPFLKAAKYFL